MQHIIYLHGTCLGKPYWVMHPDRLIKANNCHRNEPFSSGGSLVAIQGYKYLYNISLGDIKIMDSIKMLILSHTIILPHSVFQCSRGDKYPFLQTTGASYLLTSFFANIPFCSTATKHLFLPCGACCFCFRP